VLAQLAIGGRRTRPRSHRWEPVFERERFDLLAEMLARENNEQVIAEVVNALGYIYDPAAVPLLVPFASHANADIRFSVATSLGHFPNEPMSIETLLHLVDDSDRDIRDWAIFGLAVQGDADTEEIRLACLAHLRDPYLDARMEAACGLAKRGDLRVVRPLIAMFRRDGALYGIREAARDLLGLEDDPADWFEEQYLAALEAKFPEL
jgi:HEAT repeat protein